MAKDFVFNMGYDISHVISVLSKEGVDNGSKVVLITPESTDERQENSIKDIQNHLEDLDFDVNLEVLRIEDGISDGLNRIGGAFSDLQNLVVSLSGGPRDNLIPLILVSVFSSQDIGKIYFRSDINSELKEIELPKSKLDLKKSEKKVLESCRDNYRSVSELVTETDLSESTVYRKTSKLDDQGLLVKKDSEVNRYKSSGLGVFYLRTS
jgi:CRISPR locus-related DNA-binding protein